VPKKHQSRCDDVEGVQGPNRARWQLNHIDAVHRVAYVGQDEVAATVGTKLLGSCRLDQHWQRARSEENSRHRSRQNRHACHARDATEDEPGFASGQIPIFEARLMGKSPYEAAAGIERLTSVGFTLSRANAKREPDDAAISKIG
jgi:hypothetical protein